MTARSKNHDWLAQTVEDVLEPGLPICDPHHHLWDQNVARTAQRYLIDEIVADVTAGHNIVSTVFIECGAMFKKDGPEALRPVGETEFVNGIAAMSASGLYGTTRIAAGIIGTANLRLGDAVGAVLDALRRNGLDRDTMVFFLSDNGGPTKELTSRNDPLSGGKGTLQEGGIRIPFMMSWPARLPAGVVETRPVSSLDILPTALVAAGGSLPGGRDGVNLMPYLTGILKEDPHRDLYWRMGHQMAIRSGRWKLVRLHEGESFHLYDLDEDITESSDLASGQRERVRELRDRLMVWNEELVSPRW